MLDLGKRCPAVWYDKVDSRTTQHDRSFGGITAKRVIRPLASSQILRHLVIKASDVVDLTGHGNGICREAGRTRRALMRLHKVAIPRVGWVSTTSAVFARPMTGSR